MIKLTILYSLGARLGTLLRSELSALIFAKATRRKDVKHVTKHKTSVSVELLSERVVDDTPVKDAEEHDGDEQKSRQATVNLVGEQRYPAVSAKWR